MKRDVVSAKRVLLESELSSLSDVLRAKGVSDEDVLRLHEVLGRIKVTDLVFVTSVFKRLSK